uniref:Enolase-phosphatase E1 n=1 Tax=Solanum tuberosum TaxID=4113 RepID=M1AX76_SOLTU
MGEVTRTRQAWCDKLDPEGKTPCFRWQGVLNLRPPTWKSQAQTTGPPRRAYVMLNAGAVIHSHGMEPCLVTMLNPLAKEFQVFPLSSYCCRHCDIHTFLQRCIFLDIEGTSTPI